MSSTRRPPHVTAYVLAWVAAMTVAMAPAAATLATGPVESPRLLAVMVAIVAAAELTELHFRFSSRLTSAFTLIEAAVAATLLLLAPPEAVLATGTGAVVANLVRRRAPLKISFNAAQITVATFAGTLVLAALPAIGPVVGRHGIVSLALAMTAYSVVNLAGLTGLLHLMSADVVTTLRTQGWLSAAALIGGLPIGIIGVELSSVRPELVVLLLAPAASMFLAYRGVARTQQLLGQVRRDHDRLDRIVAGTSDGILLVGPDGTIEVFNNALTDLTGIPAAAAMGQPVERTLVGVRLGEPTSPWAGGEVDQLQPTRIEQAQYRHLIDGTIRTVRESHTLRFEHGRCVGNVVVITDVTREQEVMNLKSDFISRVSHELRTPLTPIKGFASMLLRRGDDLDPADRRIALERIVDRADHMEDLVTDLLRVTELGPADGGRTTDEAVSDLDVVAVSGSVVQDMAPDDRRRITVDAAVPVHARGRQDALAQVLHHLLDNALLYSAPGLPVTVRIQSVDRLRVHVAVIDQGRGIPLADQERVFEPFLRLEDPLRMTTSGVGVGLHIARRLTRDMGGDISLSSSPGAGSTFTVELPASPRGLGENEVNVARDEIVQYGG